ncbi:hypothetical protein BJY01DRAFT_227965 [Aspergillus pseudoustus]|uniref:Major facilitator superfamily (MFS) profile domain-containing protein n=1 Tax=Aspergillus pseudoustus TaxID=1810923 RepID=A0ABR4IQ11_9EURO
MGYLESVYSARFATLVFGFASLVYSIGYSLVNLLLPWCAKSNSKQKHSPPSLIDPFSTFVGMDRAIDPQRLLAVSLTSNARLTDSDQRG